MMYRTGFGYDCHRLVPGGPLVLGGVRIDCDRRLAGHSDGDAVLHAVTDALLGAIGEDDIGELFPATDQRWAGADSAVFVREAVRLAGRAGYLVGNCDVTVVVEVPRLKPYKDRMKRRIAALLGTEAGAVGVKAKTNEGIGFVGGEEALAAMAVVLVQTADEAGSPTDEGTP